MKTYDFVSTHRFITDHHDIVHNGHPILWAEPAKTRVLQLPVIALHTNSAQGPVVAACTTETSSKAIRCTLGDPTDSDPEHWPVVQVESFGKSSYSFSVDGRKYQWKRTRSMKLGGSLFVSTTFKLVDAADGNVLAVYITVPVVGSIVSDRQPVVRIDYFAELGQAFEWASMVAVLGIVDRINGAGKSTQHGDRFGGGSALSPILN